MAGGAGRRWRRRVPDQCGGENCFGAALAGDTANLAAVVAGERRFGGGFSGALGTVAGGGGLPEISDGGRRGDAVSHHGLPVQPRRKKWLVLQLLPADAPATAARPAAEMQAPGGAALKQKLDCVLQLARTVSLDFNNALTGVLAHTSLLLTKADRSIRGGTRCWRWKSRRSARRKSRASWRSSAGRKRKRAARRRAT